MNAPLLSVRDATKRFGGITAVRALSLDLAPGELRCIIGPNGAGKSTLFNMIAGTLRPSGGTIRFAEREVVGLPVHQFARLGIGRKFQIPSVFETMTVADNLQIADRSTATVGDRLARMIEMLAQLGLQDRGEILAGALAHGQKQWLEIGMALMGRPRLLLLDEPTAGMTVEETLKTAQVLRGFAGRLGLLVIEHDMRFVRALACRTTVMHQGQIIADGPFAEIEANDLVRDVYLGRQ